MCKTRARHELDPRCTMRPRSRRYTSASSFGAPQKGSLASPHGRAVSLARSSTRSNRPHDRTGASSQGSISSLDYYYSSSSSTGPYPRMNSQMVGCVMRVAGKQTPRPHPTRQRHHHTLPHQATSYSLSQSSTSLYSQPSRNTHYRRRNLTRQHSHQKKQESIKWLGVCWCCYRAAEACSCPPSRTPSARKPSKPFFVTLRRASPLFRSLLKLVLRLRRASRAPRPLPPSPSHSHTDSDTTHDGQAGTQTKGEEAKEEIKEEEGHEVKVQDEVTEVKDAGVKEASVKEEEESKDEGMKEEEGARGETWLATAWQAIKQIIPITTEQPEQAVESIVQPTLEEKIEETCIVESTPKITPEAVVEEKEEVGLGALCGALGIEQHGYLHKKSHAFFKKWQRRYFFIHDATLKYVATEVEFETMVRSGRMEGREVCHTVTTRAAPQPHKSKHLLTLHLNKPPQGRDKAGCTYMLQASSSEEASSWREAINSAVAKYLDAQAQASTSRGGLLSRLPGCVLGLACGDCNRAGSGEALEWWASLGVGVLVCTQCAGSHRALGAHITQVKSVLLDEWSEAEAQRLTTAAHTHMHTTQPLEAIGLQDLNRLTNTYLLAHMPEGVKGLSECSSSEEREDFIRHKYVHKSFSSKSISCTDSD